MMNAFQRCLVASALASSFLITANAFVVVPRDQGVPLLRTTRTPGRILASRQDRTRNLLTVRNAFGTTTKANMGGASEARPRKRVNNSNKNKNSKPSLEVFPKNPFWAQLSAHEGSTFETLQVTRDVPALQKLDYQQQQQQLSGFNMPNKTTLVAGAAALVLAVGLGVSQALGLSAGDMLTQAQAFLQHPQDVLLSITDQVHAMGPTGLLYFGLVYLVAEILAVPATPLTLSAGYLFGVTQGAAVVLVAATIAASVAFVIGKTFLREWVETLLQDQPKFAKLDKAVGQQGFKLLFLVRLSPVFPFALSNYLYGASSIDFPSYFWGTLLGFAPGTLALVYTGMVGNALTLGGAGDAAQPWYVYAGGLAALAGVLALLTEVATGIVDAIAEEEDDEVASSSSSM